MSQDNAPPAPPPGLPPRDPTGNSAATPKIKHPPVDPNTRRSTPAADASGPGHADGGHEIGYVRREEEVPVEDRALPSVVNIAPFLAAAGGAISVVGAIIAVATAANALALVLAISGLVMAAIAVALSWNDRRTGSVGPWVCAAVGLVALLIAVFASTGNAVRPATFQERTLADDDARSTDGRAPVTTDGRVD